ncbi:MAG: peptidoglycan DD-metalloendopeptidase family protein [Chloroflexi bacterium]|nr:peptidoglycan DD-metalloendopeptidase family protein [Chloroflexota bacterium]
MLILLIMIGFPGWRLAYPASLAVLTAHAQDTPAPCGYADRFDLPVPDIDFQRTDFGIYRARFGGRHTGIDVAFEQLGSPVQAAARGQVTYSDPAGWDTEKGVVVIQHTFPDGSLVNTLYGHMEELNDHFFPTAGQCVERGDIIGAIGSPSRGLPHLHYETRTRYRYEGGPGYTQVNPLELGWLHPLDFTYLANIRVLAAYRSHFSLTEGAILPPLLLSDGTYVIAHGKYLEGVTGSGQVLWRFDTFGSATGLLALPDGRVLAATSAEQVLVLANGSYSALWPVAGMHSAPLLVGNAVVFMMQDNTLRAFAPDGSRLWTTPPLNGRLERWVISGDRLAVATQDHQLSIIGPDGAILYQNSFTNLILPFAAQDGSFLLLDGSGLFEINHDLVISSRFDTGRAITSGAALLKSTSGMLYLYPGEGRAVYAYTPDGALSWIAYMPGSHLQAPRLGLGGGRLLYALTTDSQLLAYDTTDGHLETQIALYDGGIEGTASARWLDVLPDDTVRFAGGYLSVVTIDGLSLIAAAENQ